MWQNETWWTAKNLSMWYMWYTKSFIMACLCCYRCLLLMLNNVILNMNLTSAHILINYSVTFKLHYKKKTPGIVWWCNRGKLFMRKEDWVKWFFLLSQFTASIYINIVGTQNLTPTLAFVMLLPSSIGKQEATNIVVAAVWLQFHIVDEISANWGCRCCCCLINFV